MDTNEKNPGKPPTYFCKNCNFYTCNKKDFARHNITDKHLSLTNPNLKTQKNPLYTCNCGKVYKHSSSLCAHKKKCTKEELNNEDTEKSNEIQEMKEFMKYLMKENSEMKNMMLEQQNIMMKVIENGTHNTTNNTNSHNKAFNLNFFLNETCKDAMNIMDFVDSIKLQLSDLENVGKLGYVEGISNIITSNLKALDVTKRPVHCADKKREVMYVKDDDKWEKEDDSKKKIRKAIKRVVFKNQRLIPEFKKEHPDCHTYHSNFSDQYNKIIVESMGGSGDNDMEKEDKIIRNISKTITIDKEV